MNATKWLKSALILGLVGLCLAGYQACTLFAGRNALVHQTKLAAEEAAVRAAAEIDIELAQIAAVAESLAGRLSSEAFADADLEAHLRTIIEEENEILTVGVAYHPSVLGRLHAPAVTRWNESARALRVDEVQDYTVPETIWYHGAIREGGGWRQTTWSEIDDSVTVMYSTPVDRHDATSPATPAGVVFVSVSLDRIRDRVDELDNGGLGWGGILSRDGHYLVHPNEQRVEDPMTLLDVLESRGDDEYHAVIKRALEGQKVNLERSDTTTGQTAWFFHAPVEQTGWSVVLVRFEDEVLATDRPYRRRALMIVLSTVIGLIGTAACFAGTSYAKRPNNATLWTLVAFVSVVLIAGMELVRRVTYDQVSDEDRRTVRLLDEDSLSSYVRTRSALWVSRHEAPPITVPTGVLVRTLAFRGAKEVFVSGVVWQKLTDGIHDEIPRGVDLADAVEHDVVEVYRRRRDNVETVGWRFRATLRQVMDLSRYPLDHDNISIRLLPRDYDSRVLLVPDLASYTMTNPRSKPGLEDTLELSGWSIVGSFFDFKYGNYNTDLGIADYEGEESLPELHFNVELKRRVLDALIANGIPFLVVLLMLFAITVTRTDNPDRSKLFGFNPSGTMKICSALFFVVLLAHIQLRNSIQTEEIVLLEYMYFVVYTAIVLTALHTFLFFSGTRLRIITTRESLIVKLLFWPVVLGLMLGIVISLLY